jgi:hypothetical protein
MKRRNFLTKDCFKILLIFIFVVFGCSKYESKLKIEYDGIWHGRLYINDYDDQYIIGTNSRVYNLHEVNYVSARILKKEPDFDVLTVKITKIDSDTIFSPKTETIVDVDSTFMYRDIEVEVSAIINDI